MPTRRRIRFLRAVFAASLTTILLTYETCAQPYFVDQIEKSSPDGAATAILKHFSDDTSHLLYRSDAFQEFEKIETLPFLVDDFTWLEDGKSVVYLAKPSADSPAHLYKSDAAQKLTVDLTPFPRRTAAGYYVSNDDRDLFVLLDLDEQNVFDVYEIDHRSGRLVKVDAPLQFPDSYRPKPSPKLASHWVSLLSTTMPGQDPKAQQAGLKLLQIALLSDTGKESVTGLHDIAVKPWTPSERKEVEEVWRQVVTRVPGLVMRAANGRRIVLLRCSKIRQTSSHLVPGVKPQDAPAEAHPGAIFLTEEFFKMRDHERVFSLVHELVHVADQYGHLSLSKEWTELEREKMLGLRAALAARKRIGYPLGDANDDQLARNFFHLPTAYAASNFQEALADITADWVINHWEPSAREKAFIRNNLFTLDQAQMSIDENLLLTETKYKDDVTRLEIARETLRREPDNVAAQLLETMACFGLKRHNEQKVSARKFWELLKRRGAFSGDFGYEGARYFLANAEYSSGNYRVALSLVKELLTVQPDNARYKEAEKAILKAIREKKR